MKKRSQPDPKNLAKRRGAPVIDKVLSATLEDLAKHGFHGLSVPDVAERAGLNKTSVYRRWPTKTDLVQAALAQAMGHHEAAPDTGDLITDMLASTKGAAAWADSTVGRGVMRTLLADAGTPEVKALTASMFRAQPKGPHEIFKRAQTRGQLGRDADVEMALTVIAGAIVQRMFVENKRVTSSFIRRLVVMVAHGMTAPRYLRSNEREVPHD